MIRHDEMIAVLRRMITGLRDGYTGDDTGDLELRADGMTRHLSAVVEVVSDPELAASVISALCGLHHATIEVLCETNGVADFDRFLDELLAGLPDA